jgi:hypothetical protein
VESLAFALRLALAGTCLWAGAAKAFDRSGFYGTVAQLRILPFESVRIVAGAVILGELATGAMYLTGLWLGPATALALILFAAMSLAITVTLLRGDTVACHCFGAADDEPLSAWTLARSLLLFGAAVIVGVGGAQTVPIYEVPILGLDAAAVLAVVRLLPMASRAWPATSIARPTQLPPSTRLIFRYHPPTRSLFDGEARPSMSEPPNPRP